MTSGSSDPVMVPAVGRAVHGHLFSDLPFARVGGLQMLALDRADTAGLMVDMALRWRGTRARPLIMSSANGEVVSRAATDAEFAALMAESDVLSADGQPLVMASRLLSGTPLPERVATTDLFHDVARIAVKRDVTFYMLGATEEENNRATTRAASLYPGLRIVGRCHGYLKGAALADKLDEIAALAPDILWLAMGVPHEQRFCRAHAERLRGVGIIKTSGGLFNFLSGTRKRAPEWMQAGGLEWVYRIKEEPRRLFWRYAVTNPHAMMLLLSRTA